MHSKENESRGKMLVFDVHTMLAMPLNKCHNLRCVNDVNHAIQSQTVCRNHFLVKTGSDKNDEEDALELLKL